MKMRTGLLLLLGLVALASSLGSRAADIKLITTEGERQMLADPGTPVLGAPQADVTIVEYFDYNCPYCRKFAPVLREAVAHDPHLAVVFKDWPILGETSVYAARLALAAQWAGQYQRAHDALLVGSRLTDDATVHAALRKAGLDVDALRRSAHEHAAQIDALLERNEQEARALSLRGTPGIVVGRLLLPGVVDADGLRQMIAQARQVP